MRDRDRHIRSERMRFEPMREIGFVFAASSISAPAIDSALTCDRLYPRGRSLDGPIRTLG